MKKTTLVRRTAESYCWFHNGLGYGWDLGGFFKALLEVCRVILFTVRIFTGLRRSGIIAFES